MTQVNLPIQLNSQHIVNHLFNELYEEAFVLQSIQNIPENTFATRIVNFFFNIPRIQELQLNNNHYFQQISSAIQMYGHLLYTNMYFNHFDEVETTNVVHNIYNSITDALYENNNRG